MSKFLIPEGKELRIAISGKSGCGNTTVSNMIAKTLSVPCINYTFKNLGAELGLSVKEIMEKARNDSSYDKKVDSKQIELAQAESCVLASRLAIFLLKNADLKVYLYASLEKRAERVHKREGGLLEEITEFTKIRDEEDAKRYRELYNIDIDDYKAIADVIIDTDNKKPDKVVQLILEKLSSLGLVKQKH